jgi:NDP-sugar pyrophosphorylase family protein
MNEAESMNQASQATVAGIVLAGTHPWGRCILDEAIPRPLLPVADRPLIAHGLDWLHQAGVADVTICGNNDTPAIRAHLSVPGLSNRKLTYYQDTMPRGPAGCLRDAAMGKHANTLVIVDGTIVPQADLRALLSAHGADGAMLTIVVVRDPRDRTGRGDRLTPVGMYVASSEVLSHISAEGYQDIKESLIPKLHAQGHVVTTYIVDRQAPRVGCAETYLAVNGWAIGRLREPGMSAPGYCEIGEASIHQSAYVDPGARLIGPVLVGPHGTVGREAMVIGPSSIGAYSRIAEGAVVCRSAIWKDCRVGANAVLDRCILIDGTSIDPGATIRNTISVKEVRAKRPAPRAAAANPAGRPDHTHPTHDRTSTRAA